MKELRGLKQAAHARSERTGTGTGGNGRRKKARGAPPLAVVDERRRKFVHLLAIYLVDKQALRAIGLQLGDPYAKEWAELRQSTPLFGYPTVDEAEETLARWLGVSLGR